MIVLGTDREGLATCTEKQIHHLPADVPLLCGVFLVRTMTKLNYADQLKHPNWQRKRLECLNSAGFACSCCGDTESMLHVHHKRYVKGRMAWEYGLDELEVLCGQCHSDGHKYSETIDQILSTTKVPKLNVLELLIGFCFSETEDYGLLAFTGTRLREALSKPTEADAIDHLIEALNARKEAIRVGGVNHGTN